MLHIVELFAGIGAQAQALENLGIPYTSTVCEIDKRAYESYCAIHGDTPNLGDITKVEHLPQCDLLTYSFPCQDLSIAGEQHGMQEGSGTRSSLLWEVGRLLEDAETRGTLPKYLLMENVDAILNKKNIGEFNRWIDKLRQMGYTSSYQVLNAKDFGVPQNRKRCFMVSALNGKKFIFPDGRSLNRCLKDVLEEDVDKSFYLSEKCIAGFKRRKADHQRRGVNFGWEPTEGKGIAKCLNTVPLKDCQNFIITAGNLNNPNRYKSANKVYDTEGISPAVTAHAGGDQMPKIEIAGDLNKSDYRRASEVHGTSGISPALLTKGGAGYTPIIEVQDIVMNVRTRKYDVDQSALAAMLRTAKNSMKLTNKQIAESLARPVTEVEHWFRTDKSGCVPDAEVWHDLKEVLGIKTDDYDAQVCEFIQAENKYEQAQRCYGVGGLAPTLTVQGGVKVCDNDFVPDQEDGDVCAMLTPGREKRQMGPRCKTDGTAFCVNYQDRHGVAENHSGNLRIRYLTPRECWRLMGFSDEAFDKAVAARMPKTQLYKQAGNSIVVDVLMAIFKGMFIDNTWEIARSLEAWM